MNIFSKRNVGNNGEDAAVKFLKKKKYKILDRNYSAKTGEIDIICSKKDFVVFVEVKTRKKDTISSGVYAVNTRKQQHIIKTASLYMNQNKIKKQPRFDIIEVEFCDDNYTVVNHYENAFIQGGAYAVF